MITCWQDIEDRGGEDWLTPAERKLVAACKAGEPCVLGDGELPPVDSDDPERRVRAEVLWYLILGGCDDCRVQGWGVWLTGAHVDGSLDLSFQSAEGITGLQACRFAQAIVALQARFEALNLNGSHLPGLNAQGTQVTGDVFLRTVTATGEVSLAGANIGGQLSCVGTHFTAAEGGDALNAQGAQVTGDVFLRRVTATGEVSLAGANIGGQLSCAGARFTGTEGGKALFAQRLRVTEGLYWRSVTVEAGSVNLGAAHVGDLVDDPGCWPGPKQFYLDGFTYDRIASAPTDASTRLHWLAKGDTWNGTFFPQPYTQLAKVLHEMGHDRDARKVLARRERKIQADMRKRLLVDLDGSVRAGFRSVWHDLRRAVLWFWDILLRGVVGYGHHPFRTVLWLLGFWIIATGLSNRAWEAGDFAPNSGPVQVSQAWQAVAATADNPAALWASETEPGRDWETFNRYAYAADLVIPIIDLGQTDAWAPSTSRGDWGRRLWRYGFLLQIAGWIVTALGAAAITGIIRRE